MLCQCFLVSLEILSPGNRVTKIELPSYQAVFCLRSLPPYYVLALSYVAVTSSILEGKVTDIFTTNS